jgi:hypothetical protein
LNQGVDFCGVAAFAEIWHTLNQSFHEKVTIASSEFWLSHHVVVASRCAVLLSRKAQSRM